MMAGDDCLENKREHESKLRLALHLSPVARKSGDCYFLKYVRIKIVAIISIDIDIDTYGVADGGLCCNIIAYIPCGFPVCRRCQM